MNIEHKYFFPVHLDGGNRGCEGIAKGTAAILKEPKENLIGLCTNTTLDMRLGIDEYVTLCPSRIPSIIDRLMFHIYPWIWSNEKESRYHEKYLYDAFINRIDKSDYMMVTGGDMLCYGDNFINYITDILNKRGVETILWGASMGPENLTPKKNETLKQFNLIYARESLSMRFFQSIGLKNVICYPDPAFVLEPQIVELPHYFDDNNVIGINLSNFVLGGFSIDTTFGKQIKTLIDYLIKETKLQILLIPHVLWKGQDDRIVARNIKQYYSQSERISVLDTEALTYAQIRFVISHCRYFIGARTHSVISAYSTCVPTIALGYSIKSKGIAKDLGLDDTLVVNSKNPDDKEGVINAFKYLIRNEDKIRGHMESVMKDYIRNVYGVKEDLKKYTNF